MNSIDRLFEALEKKETTHFAKLSNSKVQTIVAGVIELRRTLHHYLSERCFCLIFIVCFEDYDKRLGKLNDRQKKLFKTNELHKNAVGNDYKDGISIVGVWLEKGVVCKAENDEWYHSYLIPILCIGRILKKGGYREKLRLRK